MDKNWIDLPNRMSIDYVNGIDNFLRFAYNNRDESLSISCPCRFCSNRYNFSREVVREHLISNGFVKKYKNWIHHGESYVQLHGNQENPTLMADSVTRDDVVGMVQEALGIPHIGVENDEPTASDPDQAGASDPAQAGASDPSHVEEDDPVRIGANDETLKYFKLLEDAQTDLYPGCHKFTSLSFIVRILHMKVLNQWTDKSVDMLLELLNEAFPTGTKLPSSYYQAQKVTTDLGFTYETFDACPNSCMLFRKEDTKLDKCVICSSSRWKQNGGVGNDERESSKRVAAKQMRYFPLKPRLQRLFMSSKTAKLMKWHAEERVDDGVLRHPADSLAWKDFDRRNTCFASNSRNVRLGLATDGFNPFRSMNIVHSTWPIVLIPYNLPPWMCMKQPNMILSVLIDGPKGPGDKIDVYLQPLIEELKELWNEGEQTFDASTNEMFQLHAALLWTISDFPAYANLSGWSTKGEYACPCCNVKTQSYWLKHGRKYSYMSHRRFLPVNHKFRKDKVSFDGSREWRLKPQIYICFFNRFRPCEGQVILHLLKKSIN